MGLRTERNVKHYQKGTHIMDYNKQMEVYNALAGLDGEKVISLLTDYHGMQLIDEDFKRFLVDEGVMDEDEDEDE